jgi:hypothetical protein
VFNKFFTPNYFGPDYFSQVTDVNPNAMHGTILVTVGINGSLSSGVGPNAMQGNISISVVANGNLTAVVAEADNIWTRYYWYRKAWEKKKRLELERKRKEEQEQVELDVVLDTVEPVLNVEDVPKIKHTPLADPNTHPFQYVKTDIALAVPEPATQEAGNEVAVPKKAQNDANYTYERRPVVGLARVAKRNIEAQRSSSGSITIIQKPISQRADVPQQVQELAKPVWDYNKLMAFIDYMEDVA